MPSYDELAKHDTRRSCWVIISGQVYDVTEFIDEHPGGPASIVRSAGKDATKEYEAVHAAGTIEKTLPKHKHLGPVTGVPIVPSISMSQATTTTTTTEDGPNSTATATNRRLPLRACQSLDDLEQAARAVLPARGAAYFNSAAETMTAYHWNRSDWRRIGLRSRLMRDVTKVSMRCQLMGSSSSMPVFIAPAASARLGHKDGELCLARGAARMDIPQCVCTYSSVAIPQVVNCFETDSQRRGGALFFQLYVPKIKKQAEVLIAEAKALGFKALVVTIDSPVIGKRDDDDRLQALEDIEAGVPDPNAGKLPPLPGQERGTPPRGHHCPILVWDDLRWIRQLWGDRPIILKGIQTVEDAIEASRYDVNGIYLSNHGGRQLDFAPTGIKTLIDIRRRCPEILNKLEIYVDGGVMRGTDVVKALCLGARGVGIGRGFLYALSAYGDDGVIKAIQILSDEIQTTMRLLGVTDVSQLDESYVDISEFDDTRLRNRELMPLAKI